MQEQRYSGEEIETFDPTDEQILKAVHNPENKKVTIRRLPADHQAKRKKRRKAQKAARKKNR
jgi:hypothetical protein